MFIQIDYFPTKYKLQDEKKANLFVKQNIGSFY